MHVAGFPFGEQKYRLDLFHLAAGGGPEIQRHESGHIGAETVDAVLAHPIHHGFGHFPAQRRTSVIQIDDVMPIPPGCRLEIAFPVARIPVRMLCDPRMIPSGVVGHPVQDHFHAKCVCAVDEAAQLHRCAEFRIDPAVVLHRVRTAERALAVFDPDRMHRHQPHDIDTERFQARQLFFRSTEAALGRELADVDLVDHRMLGPLRVLQMHRVLRLVFLQQISAPDGQND